MRGPGARPIPDPASRRKAWYIGLHAAIGDLYGNDPAALADKDGDAPGIPLEDFLKAVKRVFREKGYRPELLAGKEPLKLVNDTYQAYRQAARTGIAGNEIPEAMARKLDHDAFMFSGFKVHHELSEAGLSLRDEAGNLKSYEQFERDVLKIHNTYNRSWLKSEYQFAVASAQMAARWQDIEAKKDRYHLQYRTAGDDRVREEHAALHGITLPPDDPFWASYFPPNGWRCRCTAVQVNKGKYPLSDSREAVRKGEKATIRLDRFGNNKAAIFRFNPGIDERLFPPKHPYGKVSSNVKSIVNSIAKTHQQSPLSDEEKRIRKAMKELPKYLTKTEKRAVAEHSIEIEKEFSVTRGHGMNYTKANKGKENPNFNQGKEYQLNCQTCTVTHWLRRQGFDIEAKPNINGSAYDEFKKQGITWEQRFLNLDGSNVDYDFTYKWKLRKKYKTMNSKRIAEYFNEKLNHDGVYEIYCGWQKSRSAHVFLAEVTKGKVHFFDPQTGKDDVRAYIPRMNLDLVGIIRIDNKIVNPKIKNLFIKK